jgi:hypothetical protein
MHMTEFLLFLQDPGDAHCRTGTARFARYAPRQLLLMGVRVVRSRHWHRASCAAVHALQAQ